MAIFVVRTTLDLTDEADVYETGYWVARNYAGQGKATEAANAAIRYAFGHLGAKSISLGHFDGNDASRRIVEKLGFQKLRVARQASTRCLDGSKLDRHEYSLTSPDALPKLDVSWVKLLSITRMLVPSAMTLSWSDPAQHCWGVANLERRVTSDRVIAFLVPNSVPANSRD